MKTWKEKIVAVMTGRENQKLWFTHKLILNRIKEDYPDLIDVQKKHSVSQVLNEMIITGHVERAHKPKEMYDRFRYRQEYIYRLTDKAYIRPVYAHKLANSRLGIKEENVELGVDIWRKNRKLPKWFRRMMM